MIKETLFYNAGIILKDRIFSGGVLVEGTKIKAIYEDKDIDLQRFGDCILIDLQQKYLSPGFIDIHVHGGGGYDFMDGTEEAFEQIATAHARYGTTSLVPTTLTTTQERLVETLESYERIQKKQIDGAQFLGVHLEGPYFAMSQRGAQDPRYIRNPDPAEYTALIEKYDSIVRWSAAPELEGALEFGQYLRSKDIIAAIAHTDAVYEDVVKAHEVGYRLMTHFYSAMSGVTRRNAFRYAGVVEAGYLIDDFDVELIGDGIHLPEPLLQLIYKVKGPDRMVLITDAMRAAGTNDERSILGSYDDGIEVLVEDGVAKLQDRTAFAGSVATADRLVRTMLGLGNVPLEEIIRMISLNPARVMKVAAQKGSIEEGKDADLVVFDDKVNVSLTMVNGRIVYNELVPAQIA
ncbi:N-acetylglucosamine-6-phosphate deacetylase [Parapusillimonas sp. SGNA-6]|uniref:N-acetylglucosamine-6-phosphate deacetylase n=1 Tax=Parapedobacter sp. SGR-10 TaxID=2710879 RepID=UPI0013CFC312|nr:N-acetylglucosamine-6-phosphate deacetylase [Parapedobacter sp. SGR-10]NGF56366.1 N-acetylglucosamine-6-phosphate deacetylase [Parapedobacter sp. SGR-10]NGM90324.1 N-acetylglucosamine-6-phosphate deacetylase [Parapusillimonas sp. SGNA-6]